MLDYLRGNYLLLKRPTLQQRIVVPCCTSIATYHTTHKLLSIWRRNNGIILITIRMKRAESCWIISATRTSDWIILAWRRDTLSHFKCSL